MGEDLVADARRASARNAWRDACACYRRADRLGPLAPADLADWAQAEYLTGKPAAAEQAWSRAYDAWATEAATDRAVRCAFWLGLTLMLSGERAKSGGWFARAARLVAADPSASESARACVRLPEALADLYAARPAAAATAFRQIATQAEEDVDLATLARLGLGQARVSLGEVQPGLAALDEAMVAVVSDQVSPLVAGVVYCAVILTCREAFDVPRAQQWTEALSTWCDRQQAIQPYRGQCLVHRSELLQLQGQWAQALAAAEDSLTHLAGRPEDPAQGMAHYQLGELYRVSGRHESAEEAYRRAGAWGHPVQPGLALLRLAQGRRDAATRSLLAALAVVTDTQGRIRLLAAGVDIALAADDPAGARRHLEALAPLVAGSPSEYLCATCAQAAGRVLLAEGDAVRAAQELSQAKAIWLTLRAPYHAARVALDVAAAYSALGDPDMAELEQRFATELLDRIGTPTGHWHQRGESADRPSPGGLLTARQVEVLRQVAAGATNRQVAANLSISEHTVRRHLQNIFAALDLPSRTAATAWAARHGLLPPE